MNESVISVFVKIIRHRCVPSTHLHVFSRVGDYVLLHLLPSTTHKMPSRAKVYIDSGGTAASPSVSPPDENDQSIDIPPSSLDASNQRPNKKNTLTISPPFDSDLDNNSLPVEQSHSFSKSPTYSPARKSGFVPLGLTPKGRSKNRFNSFEELTVIDDDNVGHQRKSNVTEGGKMQAIGRWRLPNSQFRAYWEVGNFTLYSANSMLVPFRK